MKNNSLKLTLFFCCLALLVSLVFYAAKQQDKLHSSSIDLFQHNLAEEDIIRALGKRKISAQNLRDTLSFSVNSNKYEIISTIQLNLQEKIEQLYERYKPFYAAFVAIDPETGAVLAMADYSQNSANENLALRSSYPAASVFKIVTSAAAIESANMNPSSTVPFNGSYTTLYKRNLTFTQNRWTRNIPLNEALAKSINSIFGKIAIRMGRDKLQQYANAFGFNQKISFDMPVDISNVIVPDDDYGLAESGSGFTKRQTLSPLQGALIAATIANQGSTPRPTIIRSILDENKNVVYEHLPSKIGQPITPETALSLSQMMEKTITVGTAHKIYRDYKRHPVLSNLFIAAKTGSLSGTAPEGKYDWFVGYGQLRQAPHKKIAFASMIVNEEYWKVRSSYLARELIIEFFKHDLVSASESPNRFPRACPGSLPLQLHSKLT